MFQQFCLRFLRFCAIYDPGNSFVQLRNNIIARDYYILVELFTGSLVIHFAFDATNVAGQVKDCCLAVVFSFYFVILV